MSLSTSSALHPLSLYYSSLCYLSQNNTKEAISLLNDLINIQPNLTENSFFLLASVKSQMGEIGEAIEILKKAIEVFQDAVQIRVLMIKLLVKGKKYFQFNENVRRGGTLLILKKKNKQKIMFRKFKIFIKK
jgi:tetratricopeptide (TPR) repeat protein